MQRLLCATRLDYIHQRYNIFSVLLHIPCLRVVRQHCFMYRNRILNGQSISRHAPTELWFIRKVSDLRGTKKFANSCRATSDGVQRRNPTFVDSERRRKLGVMKGQRTDTER